MNRCADFIIVLVFILFGIIEAERYKAHDRIGLVANTVGPFNNPTETYPVRKLILTSLNLFLFKFTSILFSITPFRFVKAQVVREGIDKI